MGLQRSLHGLVSLGHPLADHPSDLQTRLLVYNGTGSLWGNNSINAYLLFPLECRELMVCKRHSKRLIPNSRASSLTLHPNHPFAIKFTCTAGHSGVPQWYRTYILQGRFEPPNHQSKLSFRGDAIEPREKLNISSSICEPRPDHDGQLGMKLSQSRLNSVLQLRKKRSLIGIGSITSPYPSCRRDSVEGGFSEN